MRQAFKDAADYFLNVVNQIPDVHWEASGLGVWSLRELVGHASRALLNVESYSERPAHLVEVEGAAGYFIEAMSRLGGPSVIAQRGRDAGAALGERPAEKVREIAERVLARVDALPDAFILSAPVGGMLLNDYLATRIFELIIHTMDICNALSLKVEPPAGPLSVTLHLLADLALREGKGPEVALALTGRRPLSQGFMLLD